jgi:hypothetical protein
MEPMSDLYSSYTFRLFKKKRESPLIEGMASILGASITSEDEYNFDHTAAEADRNALRADWLQVGKDLNDAIQEYASRETKSA